MDVVSFVNVDRLQNFNKQFTSVCGNVTYNVDFNATCTTTCCIYLISCELGNMLYVGKTSGSVRIYAV